MAESLVNPVSAAKLSPRNSEPTHLASGSYEDLGNAGEKKANYASSMSADSSIPRAVGAEPTHLDTVSEEDDDEVEVEFGDMKKDESVDDLDKAIDELSKFPVTEIHVNEADEDDDEKKDVTEEDDDEKPDFLKKKVDEADEDDDEKKDVTEEDDEDEKKKNVDEADEDDDEKKDVKESLKISIKMPKASLFESAGFNVKQQKKVASIFESAIKDTTRQVSKQIHEHYRKVHVRRLAESQRRIESRLNTYLDVVVEEWVKTNQVAVRTSLRTELSENFLNGLQKLFTEHYIDVPKSKTDVVKALTRQVETLKRQVNEQYTEKLKLRQLAETANKKRIVATFARDMSEAQAGKLEKLAEDTQYVSAKDFREKLTMLKESYFEKPTSRATRLPDENVQEVTERRGPKGEADLVADAITRQVKSSDW